MKNNNFCCKEGIILSINFACEMLYDSGSGGRISWDQNSLFHEVEFMRSNFFSFFMRSNLCLFMRSNLSNNIDQEVDTSIMRSKPKQALLKILISWLFLWLTNQSWDWNSKKSKIRQFWSYDQFFSRKCNHEIKSFYAQMANT